MVGVEGSGRMFPPLFPPPFGVISARDRTKNEKGWPDWRVVGSSLRAVAQENRK